MLSDLRFASRQLSKSPGFTATVVLTFALGIGACTAIFSVVNGVLLRPLDFPEPERLVALGRVSLIGRIHTVISAPDYIDWENQLKSFESMAAYTGSVVDLNFTGNDEPQVLAGRRVTARYFETYGIKPVLGRTFLPEEDAPGKEKVVVLSHGLWQRAFGGAHDVIGRALQLNGEPYIVVGILPPDIDVARNTYNIKLDAFIPMAWSPNLTDNSSNNRIMVDHAFDCVGRLKRGVTVAQADAELKVLAAQLAEQYPVSNEGWSASARPMLDYVVGDNRNVLYTLLGAVGCVLVIACANIANLLLARATARHREMSIRAALGAGRGRLMRQLLTESVLLALLGGTLGVLFAWWGLDALLALAPARLPRAAAIQLDSTALAASMALSTLTGIAVGLAPAWLAACTDVNEALKQGSRGSTEDGAHGRLRSTLVVVEVAAALVLLAGASLLVRSFINLTHVDPGFTTEQVTMLIRLRGKKSAEPAQRGAFADALLARLGALPGVQTAALADSVPFVSALTQGLLREGQPYKSDADLSETYLDIVTPGYFEAMGIRLVRGRLFTAQDDAKSAPVALINQTLAQQLYPHEDPIGKRIRVMRAREIWSEIVGVVSDIKRWRVTDRPTNQSYEPFAQRPSAWVNVVLRTARPPAAILRAVRPIVYAIDLDQPVGKIQTLKEAMAGRIARERFAMTLLTVFSLVALVIASVGIYGVIAYTVSLRTQEIGIRMALGASQTNVLRQVLAQGMKLVGIGIALGLVVALALGRLIEAQLFQTSPYDPLTLVLVPLILAGVGLIACLVPARHATKVDPIVALRAE